MKDAINFRVTSRGVIINIKPDRLFSEVVNALKSYIGEANDFFAGVDLYLNLEGCTFTLEEMQELTQLVSGFDKISKVYFYSEKVKAKKKTMDTILINRTIRSGQCIKYPANIVVIGDVNPGAEVIAGGDILVIGKLRGVVHAGATGAIDSQVIALKLQPTQLRIGNIISRPPEDTNISEPLNPERAYIKDGMIIVEELQLK